MFLDRKFVRSILRNPETAAAEVRDLPFGHMRRPAWPLDMDTRWEDLAADTWLSETLGD